MYSIINVGILRLWLLIRKKQYTAQQYYDALQKKNIPVKQLFIFGSAARGTRNQWSDIDLAVVSERFANDRVEEMVILQDISRFIDPAISPVPLRSEDLSDRFSTIAEAIRREGQLVAGN